MTNTMEKLYTAGALIGVILICFDVFWSGLSANPSYAGNYTNINSNPYFAQISASSASFSSSEQQIQQAFKGMQSPIQSTVILSVLSLVAFTMFQVIETVITLPISLMDIFSASLSVIGAYINVSVLAGALVLLFIVRGIFGILRDQGAVR
jgi:hypothetical protein